VIYMNNMVILGLYISFFVDYSNRIIPLIKIDDSDVLYISL